MFEITVYGRPQQKGSKVPFIHRGTGRACLKDANPKAMQWQEAIRAIAGAEYKGELFRGPVRVSGTFVFARPKKHYYTGKRADVLRDDAPKWHLQKPDVDKIMRTVLDGMQGIVYADDSQAQLGPCDKIWGEQDYSTIRVKAIE
jgi:Holliday junction resolvase RusA-like endonuclease